MSRPQKVISVGFLTLYTIVVVALWVAALRVEGDTSRATLLGVAGAATGGLLAVVGGWFTAWRNEVTQAHRDDEAAQAQADRDEALASRSRKEVRRACQTRAVITAQQWQHQRDKARSFGGIVADGTKKRDERGYAAGREKEYAGAAELLQLQLMSELTELAYLSDGDYRGVVEDFRRQVELRGLIPKDDEGILDLEAFEDRLTRADEANTTS